MLLIVDPHNKTQNMVDKPLTLVTADSQTSSVSSLAAFMQHEESTGALRTLQDFDLQMTCWVHSKLFRMMKFEEE
jgi:hypothetical protein